MDKIIEGYINSHIDEYSLDKNDLKGAFEHFINRCIVNKYSDDRFDPDDIQSEKGEIGIDGIAILLNNKPIFSIDDVNQLIPILQDKEVYLEIVFIQSTTSSTFDSHKIEQFVRGVKNFFEKENRVATNEKIEELYEIIQHIYDTLKADLTSSNIEMYYAYCGDFENNNNFISVHQNEIKEVSGCDVKFYIYDSGKIKALHKELRKQISKTITLEKFIPFPKIDKVSQAYIGLISCKELVSLLHDDDEKLLSTIFEDNVRDFKGFVGVNLEIQKTLEQESLHGKFAILHNGITIIAREIEVKGEEITIKNYQIVNGCQTSYILFNMREKLTDNAYVPIKILGTDDSDIADTVTIATNSQTPVTKEAFITVSPFHKTLEEYYLSLTNNSRLYYERRSRQYDLKKDINKKHIITLATQTFSYIAVAHDSPQSTLRYYGEVLEAYKIYKTTDLPNLYYCSAYLVWYVEQYLNKKHTLYRPFKYHIAYGVKILIFGVKKINEQQKKQILKNTEFFENIIYDTQKLDKNIETVLTSIVSYTKDVNIRNKQIRHGILQNKKLTDHIKKELDKYNTQKQENQNLRVGDIACCTIDTQELNFYQISICDSPHTGIIYKKSSDKKYIIGQKINVKIVKKNEKGFAVEEI